MSGSLMNTSSCAFSEYQPCRTMSPLKGSTHAFEGAGRTKLEIKWVFAEATDLFKARFLHSLAGRKVL